MRCFRIIRRANKCSSNTQYVPASERAELDKLSVCTHSCVMCSTDFAIVVARSARLVAAKDETFSKTCDANNAPCLPCCNTLRTAASLALVHSFRYYVKACTRLTASQDLRKRRKVRSRRCEMARTVRRCFFTRTEELAEKLNGWMMNKRQQTVA